MGHALNNTLQDILCRFERMRGKDVLWQPGTDHAGIATQAVVERQLMERQEPGSREMGREAFIKRVWEWKAESGGTIIGQLKRLGASCDWSRERFTMDEGLSRAVMKVFVALYREGLIYKDKRLVNWDPKLKTAISDLEVQQVEIKGHLWHIKYPIEGSDEFIVVATTRPETMLGDTAVAVHPDNERLKHLIGKHAILPLVGRRIPIIGDDYADPEKGTGAVKITPAHDFNDFEVGRRHDLPLINVLDVEGQLDLRGQCGVPARRAAVGRTRRDLALHGLDRFAARKRIVEQLEARGLLEKIEPTTHVVPHGDRSGAVIEPFLTDQWYVDAKTLAQPAIAAVRERQDRVRAAAMGGDVLQLDGEHPAVVHLAPDLVGPSDSGLVRPGRQDLRRRDRGRCGRRRARALHRDRGDHGRGGPRHRRRPGAARALRDRISACATKTCSTPGFPRRCGRSRRSAGRTRRRSSKRFYPTSALVTGFDIIFFWVARMMMMGLHFMKEVPFHDVYIHALVRDATGAKMSKSKGNVIDPLGSDRRVRRRRAALHARRHGGAGPRHQALEQRVEGYRNFATKLWNAARFAEIQRLRARSGFRSAPRQGDAQPLDHPRDGADRAGGHGGARSLSSSTMRRTRSIASSGTSSATGIWN